MDKLFKLVFSKKLLSIISFLFQIFILAAGFVWFKEYFAYVYWVQLVVCAGLIIYEMQLQKNPAFQLTWICLVALAPTFTILLYLLVRFDTVGKRISRRLNYIVKTTNRHLPQKPDAAEQLEELHPRMGGLANYLRDTCGFPVYQNTDVKYYPLGELMFEELKKDLHNAKKFIFVEFFIIHHGIMWSSIHEILKEKAAQGVEVRVMYDGMGCVNLLPRDYHKTLEEEGILCHPFAPVYPLLSSSQNNRDHRKIVVVDGEVAYTGGVNLGDEYINRIERFGHWKDTAIRVTGDAVDSFSMMFLQLWNASERKKGFNEEEYLFYLTGSTRREKIDTKGFVIPFGDSPLDEENTGERVYMDLLHTAQKYVHIVSPYLIPSSEMRETLKYTAKRGVEVILLLPHIPDKPYVKAVARTYYSELIRGGVKIYEYTPGFVHAKMSISDDTRAVVGTINHDFRSLFLHYECAALMIDCPVVPVIETDFQQALKLSQRVTLADYMKISVISRFFGYLLRLFAPLL
ncbi:MAG: cardiolipin synthase [Ruminococcaceae bacterium]|nr:cardiolipin synthase [Oscillospiraceae bacterium]